MKYLVLDIETESDEYRRRFGDPLEKKNKIVMLQAKVGCNSAPYIFYNEGDFVDRNVKFNFGSFDLLVGQNIRYDLLYLWENESLQEWIKNDGKIWDTKVVEYLITGQNKSLRYDLDTLAEKYGAEVKPTEIKELYAQGDTTMSIIGKLGYEAYLEYAAGDVLNTETIFLLQYDYVQENGLQELVEIYMKHALATMEIEYNGLCIDRTLLHSKKGFQELLVNTLAHDITIEAEKVGFGKDTISFDVNSNDHISALLFGGKFKKTVKEIQIDLITERPVYYKTGAKKGEPKYKNKEIEVKIKGFQYPTVGIEMGKKLGVYPTGEAVLKNLKNTFIGELLLNYREANKLLTTYYSPFLDLINPATGCIHSEFNLCGTRTGRLASRNPNIQNLDPKVLDCIVSRFENGTIVEFDWKQLEVVLAALLSKDEVLLAQLASDIDMHQLNAMSLFSKRAEDVTAQERKLAKFMTFGILYGAGASRMAEQHSIDVELAKEFIDQFYQTYPQIKMWHENLGQEAIRNTYEKDGKTYSFIDGQRGKQYHIEAYPAKFDWQKKKGIEHSFLPTEYKNYPVQGLAADIQSYFVGLVYSRLQNSVDFKLINEVHDSVILDCTSRGIRWIKQQEYLDPLVQTVNMNFNSYYAGKALLKLEHKEGKTWGEIKNG